MKKGWVFTPPSGGRKVPTTVQEVVRQRILQQANKNYAGKFSRIDVRFRGALCYIDAYQEPAVGREHPTASLGETRQEFIERLRHTPTHLCRLRHFGIDR